MRFLSVVILFCIFFLSIFPKPENSAAVAVADCCKKDMTMACDHKTGNQKDKNNTCNDPYCTAVFSCSLCGFIVQQPLIIKPVIAKLLPKPVACYNMGIPYDYHQDDWKPPKAC